MALHREVGAVDLEDEALRHDVLVLGAERGRERVHVVLEAGVVRVRHRGRDDARRGRGHERLDEAGVLLADHLLEQHTLAFERGAIDVAHLAHRPGGRHEAHLGAREIGQAERQVGREVRDVAHDGARARAPEAAHPVLHIGEEALARLLAVVADVDARRELPRDDPARRVADRPLELRRLHRLAPAPPHEERGQLGRARQAPRVRGEDAALAALHR